MKKLYTIFILLFFIANIQPLFAEDDAFLVNAPEVPESVTAGDDFAININIDIQPHYFLYEDKMRVEFEPSSLFTFGQLQLSDSVAKYDKFLEKDVKIYKNKAELSSLVSFNSNVNPGQYSIGLTVYYQGCSEETCFLPMRKKFTVPVTVTALTVNKIEESDPGIDADNGRELTAFENTIKNKGLFGALLFAFLAGIGLSFTPCIYPMIPITVAIIGGQETNSPFKGFYLSLVYVLGIAVIYSALGVAAASTGALFGSAVNSPWVVSFVAVVFIALAFSMFGVYELKMPTAMAEKFGGKGKSSGVIGIFFMGLVSGTVASPCVGPVLVSLLVYIAGTGNKVLGFWLLFVLAWGMGLLLIVVGTFSGVVKSLPKSGGWMVMVKKIMGILLLGAALYYIKPVIQENIFLVILGVFFITVGVFSGGLDRLVSESTVMLRVKKSFGVVCIIFGIYFLVGTLLLNGLILKPLSAVLSPSGSTVSTQKEGGIQWVLSEPEGRKIAQERKMPVMIDFWAEWCSVCKKLDKKTLHDPDIIDESKRFVNIKVDCTNTDDNEIKKLWAKYNIVGLPTIIFIDKTGKVRERSTINKFVTPVELKKIMNKI